MAVAYGLCKSFQVRPFKIGAETCDQRIGEGVEPTSDHDGVAIAAGDAAASSAAAELHLEAKEPSTAAAELHLEAKEPA
jgi:hypothetical protein